MLKNFISITKCDFKDKIVKLEKKKKDNILEWKMKKNGIIV